MACQKFTGFEQITDNLFWWEVFDEGMKCPLSASAFRTMDGLILVDPVDLPEHQLSELTHRSAPCAVLLTNHNHERAAGRFQKRFKIPLYAPRAGHYETVKPDILVGPDTRLPGGLEVVPMPGTVESETAYRDPRDGGTLLQGDSLVDMGRGGLEFLPAKYANDTGRMRMSVAGLLRRSFSIITTAHGKPVRDPKPIIRKLLGQLS